MKTVLRQGEYRCVILGENDFELFHTARTLCFMDKTADEIPRIDRMKEAIAEHGSAGYWQNIFLERGSDREFFVLLKSSRAGKDIAGIVDLNFSRDDIPYLSTLHVLSQHRGLYLSDLLHRVVRDQVLEFTMHDDMGCEIDEKNIPSIRSAERNGFVSTRMEDLPDGRRMKHFVRSLRYERGLINAFGAESVLAPTHI